MSGGVVLAPAGRVRIKGHAGSVTRFFFISVAFTVVWILITSQLGYYSKLYGPQVLLWLNIAFYLPSIPVLILSGQLEKVMDVKFGPTSSLMIRLNSGLTGCLVICAAFPFFPRTYTSLLLIVVALGTVSAIAFSSAYQLVSWFRAADTITLGIGCVGSGPLVLALQLLLEVGPQPERWQWVAMFELAAAIVLTGLLSSLSLFGQYWKILSGEEAYSEGSLPLLESQHLDASHHSEPKVTTPRRLMTAPDPFMPVPLSPDVDHSAGFPELDSAPPVLMRRAMSAGYERSFHGRKEPVAKTNSLRSLHRPLNSEVPLPHYLSSRTAPTSPDISVQEAITGSSLSVPSDSLAQSPTKDSDAQRDGPSINHTEDTAAIDLPDEPFQLPEQEQSLRQEYLDTFKAIWGVVTGFFCSVTVLYLVFPFFTYVPSSGLLGDRLPQFLFYTRLFADIAGRFLPRSKFFVIRKKSFVMALAVLMVAVSALFFAYIKGPDKLHHDMLSLAIIVLLWLTGGYLNTCCNILAPNLVPAHLTARASAIMAIVFQFAHFFGLILAGVVAAAMYGVVVG